MKTITKKLRIAHVGAFRDKSSEDGARSVESLYRILQHDRDFIYGTKPNHDTINLIYGRDFLKESRTYDLVILHSIFHVNLLGLARGKDRKQLSLSSKHSVLNWVRRLIKTRAIYISVCEGQPHSLSGWHLGEIPGYEILERDAKVTLYKALGESYERDG